MRLRSFAVLLGTGIAFGCAGCSLEWKLGSLMPEDITTGSITPRQVSPLSPQLDEEDWRRAKAALAVALDPRGNGTPVPWDNPATGRKGHFTPQGMPFASNDLVCRSFVAELKGAGPETQLQGAACKSGPDDWQFKDVKPLKKAG